MKFSMAQLVFRVFLAFGTWQTFSSLASPDVFLHPWTLHTGPRGHCDWSGDFDISSTSSNFDANGTNQTPTGFEKYSRYEVGVGADCGYSKELTAFGRLNWARIEVDGGTRPGTAYGLGDQLLGLSSKINDRGPSEISFDVQFQMEIPAYSNSTADSYLVPELGDGSLNITGGGFVTAPFSTHWKAIAGAGYMYRSGGYSSAFPWSAQAEYFEKENYFVRAGLAGLQSLSSGSGIEPTSIGTGGIFMTGSPNPSFMNLIASAGYRFDPQFQASVSLQQTLSGKEAPSVLSITAGVQYFVGSNDSHIERRVTDPLKQTPSQYGKSNQGMVNYSLDAHIVKTNDRLNLVKIDKGSQDGVAVGDVFDIFSVNMNGKEVEAIARARVTDVKSEEAALSVIEYFKEVFIEQNFIAKKVIP